MVKQLIDFIVAFIAVVLLSPLLLLLSIITAICNKGTVLFKQERIGQHGKPFTMYKFVSMYKDSEINGPQLWFEDDKRQTTWGKFMRKRRLDELPQLFNILMGDMSFVGPTRPERQFYIDQIVKLNPDYLKLLQHKPGLTSTGIVQYGYASSLSEMLERTEIDLQYLNNPSLSKDFLILFAAFKKIIVGKGNH